MTVQIKYNCLCEDFISVTQSHVDESLLKLLKEHYARSIDSNRKLSQIKDLRSLLKILEKRDTLGYNNVEPLIYISNCLNNSEIQKKIKDYKVYLQNFQYSSYCDMYKKTDGERNKSGSKSFASQSKVQEKKVESQSVSLENANSSTAYLDQDEILQKEVLSEISKRIGRSWRDTARFLKIPEYQIDIIQNKYPFDLKEQSYEALKLCISECSTEDWKLNLLHALEKARRRDLKELVERLIIQRMR